MNFFVVASSLLLFASCKSRDFGTSHVQSQNQNQNEQPEAEESLEYDVNVGQELWIFKDVKPFDVGGKLFCLSNADSHTFDLAKDCTIKKELRKLECKTFGGLEAEWSPLWLSASKTDGVPDNQRGEIIVWDAKILNGGSKKFNRCAQATSGTYVRAE